MEPNYVMKETFLEDAEQFKDIYKLIFEAECVD